MKKIDAYIEFLLREKGEQILYKDQTVAAILTDSTSSSSYYNDKFIVSDFPIQTGGLLEYQDKRWLIISEVTKRNNSYKAKMRKCNYIIKLVLDGVLSEFDAIISSSNFGVNEGSIITVAEGKIEVILSDSPSLNKLTRGLRFIKMGSGWRITGIDRTQVGLVTLHADIDLFVPEDDITNEIANADKLSTWQIVINEEVQQILLNQSTTYTCTVTKDNLAVPNAEVVWAVSDTNILEVNGGIVTAKSVGKSLLYVYIKDNSEIMDLFEIEVTEQAQDVITYKIWSIYIGETAKSYTYFEIFPEDSQTYGIDKFNNGVLVPNTETYTFTLETNGANSSYYKFSIIDGNQCKVQVLSTYLVNKQFKLKAVSNETGTVIEQTISISGW